MRGLLILLFLFTACNGRIPSVGHTFFPHSLIDTPENGGAFLIVLGTVQDAGSPQLGCVKACCAFLSAQSRDQRKVVSLGLVDTEFDKNFLFDATPDIRDQLALLHAAGDSPGMVPAGILMTHAHIGHYTGLMYLGKESANTDSVPVYAMNRMRRFLTQNGPWDQLKSEGNINIKELRHEEVIQLTPNIAVYPFRVPHRDEYSETVGFLIKGPHKKALFIPDIDKWERWEKSIIHVLSEVDYALLDATFYDGAEVNTRNIAEIPHPFVIESLDLFKGLSGEERDKIHFIHFNHTNPLLDSLSAEYRDVVQQGYHVARIKQRFPL